MMIQFIPSCGRSVSLVLALTVSLALGPLSFPQPAMAQIDPLEEYARYTEQASQLFNSGQLTQAIEVFEKALSVAPETSLPVVYNNLAVTYIKRGNYFHDKMHQEENALNDFRKAYFYLITAWPEGMDRKPLHDKNREIITENLKIAYRNLNIKAADKEKHLEMAKQLRMQGKFPEAIVEYEQVLTLDKQDAVAAKALGDLFTVVNLPEKAKKYYSIAVSGPANKGVSEDETLVQLGNAQYKTGEIDKAIANFDKALLINPNNVSALNMLEKIWLNEIKFHPDSVLGHANLGSVYQKKKMYEQAYQQYNAAEHFAERDPKTPFDTKKLIRLNMGTLFQHQKKYEMALKAYETVLLVEPNHLQANFYKATLLDESGNIDAAMQAYNKVLSIDPNHKAAQEKLLAMAKKQSDPAKLTAGLKQYADRYPSNATIQAQIGEEFHARNDLANAALYYQKALQVNPNLASAWGNLGAIYQSQGKDEESMTAFQKAMSLEPENDTFKQLAHSVEAGIGYKAYQQAVSLQQEGKSHEALSYFRKALTTMDSPELQAAYGVSLQSVGQLDEAIAAYRKALEKDTNNADYTYYIGTAHHQKKDLVQAEAAYKKALALKPDYTEARQAMEAIQQETASADLAKAVEAYNQKSYPAALKLVSQALEKNRKDAMAHYYKGLILDAQKKTSQAAQSYRDAIQYNPDFTDAYYALGVALDNVKDPTGAKTAFEKFVTLSGTHEDDFVKYARERLQNLSQSQ